ncbi:MAG: hypothetical protein K2J32_14270 [Ruminococcus sp.]|nr:hypothetical protein [Ruminococcus sp.]
MKNHVNFKKVMHTLSFASTLLTIILFALNNFINSGILLALAVTSMTSAYHFDIRLIIGYIIPLFKGKINVDSRYFKVSETEKNIYKKLNVKKWKSRVPTYNPDEFDIKKNSIQQLIINCCNSEIVHTANIFVSYIPILFSIWFNSLFVFIITSVLASIYDLQFVILQRYNRPRLIKSAYKKEENL